MGEDSGEKTEEPTPHKLREARKKGQIAKSKEFTSAILLFVAFYSLKATAPQIWGHLSGLVSTAYSLMSGELNSALYGELMMHSLTVMFLCLGPIFIAIFIVGTAVEALQTGFLFAIEALQPKFDNLNPINGFKKFFSMKQYVELFKSLVKMALVITILFFVVREQYFIISQAQARNIWLVLVFVSNLVIMIVTRVGILYIIIAFLDFLYQRYEFTKSMRMTKKEIKEEYKRLEGDPTVKQRQKQAQRDMAQGRQMGAVPGADVVVTNPTHIAVAIQYDSAKKPAPTVVAMGQQLIAQEIKNIASQYQVTIIENPPLARKLFKEAQVGSVIPLDTYKIVAEILAFVYHLKKKRKKIMA